MPKGRSPNRSMTRSEFHDRYQHNVINELRDRAFPQIAQQLQDNARRSQVRRRIMDAHAPSPAVTSTTRIKTRANNKPLRSRSKY